MEIIKADLAGSTANCRIGKRTFAETNIYYTFSEAVRRFFALWKNRFYVWLKMEDNAQMIFKV